MTVAVTMAPVVTLETVAVTLEAMTVTMTAAVAVAAASPDTVTLSPATAASARIGGRRGDQKKTGDDCDGDD